MSLMRTIPVASLAGTLLLTALPTPGAAVLGAKQDRTESRERAAAERQEARALSGAAHELHREVDRLLRHAQELHAHGKVEDARAVEQRARHLRDELQIHIAREHQTDRQQDRENDFATRVRHARQAIEHLRAAGMDDLAERAMDQLERHLAAHNREVREHDIHAEHARQEHDRALHERERAIEEHRRELERVLHDREPELDEHMAHRERELAERARNMERELEQRERELDEHMAHRERELAEVAANLARQQAERLREQDRGHTADRPRPRRDRQIKRDRGNDAPPQTDRAADRRPDARLQTDPRIDQLAEAIRRLNDRVNKLAATIARLHPRDRE